MAWVTPTTVATGDVLTAATWNQAVQANGAELAPFFSAWTDWTPVVKQNGTRTHTTTYAKYLKIGRLVIINATLTITQAGSAGNTLTVEGLPFSAATNSPMMGSYVYVKPGTAEYGGVVFAFSAGTAVNFSGTYGGNSEFGGNPSVATANGDVLRFSVMYEAAS